MSDIIQKNADACGVEYSFWLQERLRRVIEQKGWALGSKIEEALLLGLLHFDSDTYVFDFVQAPAETFRERLNDARPWFARVEAQANISTNDRTYRADFLIEIIRNSISVGSIVVECDGHEFHERTPEQAERDRSRDRDMTAAGHKVLRFTGREVYRSAADCAGEVFKLILQIADATRP